MILMIGSVAVNAHFNFRVSTDTDLIGYRSDFIELVRAQNLCVLSITHKKGLAKDTTGKFVEYHFIDDGGVYSQIYHLAFSHGKVKPYQIGNVFYPSLEFLLSLKMSHRFRDHTHFMKTRHDIIHLTGLGVSPLQHQDFSLIEKEFIRAPVKLSENANDFFRKSDKFYEADHDDIHRAIISPKTPAYMSILGDDAEVFCDPQKWLELPHEEKLRCVVEETCTLAIERILIPSNGLDSCMSGNVKHFNGTNMFHITLQKVCTRITSGRFRTFAWNNMEEVIALYHIEYYFYVDRFINACVDGRVRKFVR